MTRWEKLRVERVALQEPSVTIARLHGALLGTPEGYAFLEEVQEAARKAPLRLVIDLTDVPYVDSSGVGILAASYTSITNHGGRMCLMGVQGRTAMILKVVHLFDVLGRAETEAEALQKVRA